MTNILIKLTKLNQEVKSQADSIADLGKSLALSEFNLRSFEMFVTEFTRNREQNLN